jgi:N-acetyl-gamma-glutamyl-phosphate reductase
VQAVTVPSEVHIDQKVARVGVYGATGYTGQILLEILAKHPHAKVIFATSESSKETVDGLELIPSEQAPLNTDAVDVVFLALPNGVSGGIAAKAVAAGVKVVDLSADLRLDSLDDYAKWYKLTNPAPELLPAPYGLPELPGKRAKIAQASYVANPGCHVTATLLALAPLAAAGALTGDPIIADTKTGISGAGKALKADSMFGEVYGDVRPYNLGRAHRHVPEIEQELRKIQPDAGQLVFVPHVVPLFVGLLATVYARVKPGFTVAQAQELFTAAYANEPLVKALPAGQVAQVKHVANKNTAEVGVSAGGDDLLVITSAIDNLRKGASSQAVQNFNIMMGFAETEGLL